MVDRLILSPSCPHNGLHFVYEQLAKPKFERRNLEHKEEEYAKYTLLQGHLYDYMGYPDQWKYLGTKYKEAIIPLRHPYRVLDSFYRRYEKDGKYPVQYYHHMMALLNVVESFEKEGVNILYFHLDDKEARLREAKAIQEFLGNHKDIDWWPTKENGCVSGTHDIELNHDYSKLVPQVLVDFYEGTK